MSLQPLFVLMSAFLLPNPAIATFAQTRVPIALEARPSIPQVLFKPTGGGKPPTTRGAGSRNDRLCPQDAARKTDSVPMSGQPLTALVPNDQFGVTNAERPTFWVFLPQTSARQLVLSVKVGSQSHFQQFLPITEKAGIVGIPLPATAPILEVGKVYQWAIVLLCGDRPSPNDPFVTGWVQRVLPTPEPRSRDVLEQAQKYGQQGIWYDALTTLATAVRSQPNNAAFTSIWTDFLVQPSVGLEAIASEPLR